MMELPFTDFPLDARNVRGHIQLKYNGTIINGDRLQDDPSSTQKPTFS